MDSNRIREAVADRWSRQALPTTRSLAALVAVPALSPAFDERWEAEGHLRTAVDHVRAWITARALPGTQAEVIQADGCPPLLLVEFPATRPAADNGTVLIYGHLDRQPPLDGWSDGLAPWHAVLRDGKLYGRGTVDGGYAGYAVVTALEAARAAGGQHSRVVLLLETGAESGSPHMSAYLEQLEDRIGRVTLVLCLDSGGDDFERLWVTDSLRGMARVTLTVRVLDQAQHSGLASGIVPDSFRIMRELLDRVEDPASGRIKLEAMHAPPPAQRRAQAETAASLSPGTSIGPGTAQHRYPLVQGMRPAQQDDVELILNNTWHPTLTVLGAAGLPLPPDAGNVLRTETSLVLGFRLAPTADPEAAKIALHEALTTNVPYGATVRLENLTAQPGWLAPTPEPWLETALSGIDKVVFGNRHVRHGSGASIPVIRLLHQRYPEAQFVVTGALGPNSNPHSPDECLDLAFAQRITEFTAHLLDAHAYAPRRSQALENAWPVPAPRNPARPDVRW